MKPIAVFYHARVCGGDPPIADGHALAIMDEQMHTLRSSGLLNYADEVILGMNGGDETRAAIEPILAKLRTCKPTRLSVVLHGPDANYEVPTVYYLQKWLPAHPGWHVCYFHNKGAKHANDPTTLNWRRCMEACVIWNWWQAVTDLENGRAESVGCHWLTSQEFGPHVDQPIKGPIWGGNFWWATSEFLSTLPALPRRWRGEGDNFLAEHWIGMGPRPPVTIDYAHHWPNLEPCRDTISHFEEVKRLTEMINTMWAEGYT